MLAFFRVLAMVITWTLALLLSPGGASSPVQLKERRPAATLIGTSGDHQSSSSLHGVGGLPTASRLLRREHHGGLHFQGAGANSGNRSQRRGLSLGISDTATGGGHLLLRDVLHTKQDVQDHDHQLGAHAASGEGASLTERTEVIPFSLTAQMWDYSGNVSFHNTHTDVPVTGWIMSKAELVRPTVVEAEIRSSGKPGVVGMTVFSEMHGPLEIAHYSVTTGYGEWHDGVLSLPGDERMTTGFNNMEGQWDLIRFDLGVEVLSIYVNEKLIHNSTDTTLTKGKVQFLAEQEPMQVRGVQWRQDCKYTSWQAGPCSVTCGEGTLISRRDMLTKSLFGGRCLGGNERTDHCYKGPCEGFDFR